MTKMKRVVVYTQDGGEFSLFVKKLEGFNYLIECPDGASFCRSLDIDSYYCEGSNLTMRGFVSSEQMIFDVFDVFGRVTSESLLVPQEKFEQLILPQL